MKQADNTERGSCVLNLTCSIRINLQKVQNQTHNYSQAYATNTVGQTQINISDIYTFTAGQHTHTNTKIQPTSVQLLLLCLFSRPWAVVRMRSSSVSFWDIKLHCRYLTWTCEHFSVVLNSLSPSIHLRSHEFGEEFQQRVHRNDGSFPDPCVLLSARLTVNFLPCISFPSQGHVAINPGSAHINLRNVFFLSYSF